MAQIKVIKQGPETFAVTVTTRTTTVHTVMLSDDYYRKLAGDKITPEQLIEKSFEFLLERESNATILPSFELPVIARYFPEFEKVIASRL